MTDPERISKRASGLAAELLQAGSDEQPSGLGMERTLAALGVSGAVLTSAGGATAAAGATAASATKVVTATLLAKWIGIGVVGGVVLSGAAAAVSPAPSASVAAAHPRAVPVVPQAPAAVVAPSAASVPLAAPAVAEAVEAPPSTPSAPRVGASRAEPGDVVVEVGAPLAAEVAFIDRARAQLAAGQAEQGLLQLGRYEQEFPEARLLPEVLFLRMETCDRLGRSGEARAAATRLVEGFPKSPHATRARKLLGPRG
jgi:hypothetical protein